MELSLNTKIIERWEMKTKLCAQGKAKYKFKANYIDMK